MDKEYYMASEVTFPQDGSVVPTDTQAQAAVTDVANNPSGNPGPNTQVFDDGSTLQTFDDGSTLATATDGSVSSTPAPVDKFQVLQQAIDSAQSEFDSASADAAAAAQAVDDAQNALDTATASGDQAAIDQAQAELTAAQQNSADAQERVINAQAKLDQANQNYQNAVDGATSPSVANPTNSFPSAGDGTVTKNLLTGAGLGTSLLGSGGLTRGLSSVPRTPTAAGAQFSSKNDLRVKLRVPTDYLVGLAAGPQTYAYGPPSGLGALADLGGIVWPYTPQVSWSNTVNYQQNKLIHSNYAFYNFQNGAVGPISVSGKFTAQTEYEAAIILSVVHLFRALTKMRWGDDVGAGAPPPICRLDAYGDGMLQNVPVAVANWKMELPENVDYIQVGPGIPDYGYTMVPTSCTISCELNVMYSRAEMQSFGVDKWLAPGNKLRGQGYL